MQVVRLMLLLLLLQTVPHNIAHAGIYAVIFCFLVLSTHTPATLLEVRGKS